MPTKPTSKKRKFKKGDRVICVRPTSDTKKGVTGVFKRYYTTGTKERCIILRDDGRGWWDRRQPDGSYDKGWNVPVGDLEIDKDYFVYDMD